MESKKTLQLVAGPTIIPADVRALYAAEYGSSDIEEEFYQEYGVLCDRLQSLLLTKNDVVCPLCASMEARTCGRAVTLDFLTVLWSPHCRWS
jgi:aspartate aminotransferase-like enzyme